MSEERDSPTREYSNGEVTVVWKPEKCIHSGICVAGLRAVFDPKRRPWIDVSKATSAQIVAQVHECPSGALSIKEEAVAAGPGGNVIEVTANGPLLVHGSVTVKRADGTETKHQRVTALCRCGQSSKKPYCDGSHTKAGFTG